MLLASLPGYVRQPRPGKRSSRPKGEVLLGFEDFTARLLAWMLWWNTEHRPAPLRGRIPLEVWQDDLTLLRDVPTDLCGRSPWYHRAEPLGRRSADAVPWQPDAGRWSAPLRPAVRAGVRARTARAVRYTSWPWLP